MKQRREGQSMKMEGRGRWVSKVRSKQSTQGGVRGRRLFNSVIHAHVWVSICTWKMSGTDKRSQPLTGEEINRFALVQIRRCHENHSELEIKGTVSHFENYLVLYNIYFNIF